jgi:hypothetical protein
VTSYLGRFTQNRDELAIVGEIVDPEFLVRTASPNIGVHLYEALWPGSSCPIGRDSGTTSYRRSRDVALGLQDCSVYLRVMRILLFGQRARRRSARVLDKVPRWGPSHSRVAMGERET